MECYLQGAIRKELLITPFLDTKNNYLGKVRLQMSNNTSNKMPKHCIFAKVFLIEDYVQGALRKELFIAPFVERFNTATLGKSYRSILPVLGTIYLNFAFLPNFQFKLRNLKSSILSFYCTVLFSGCSTKKTLKILLHTEHLRRNQETF